MAKLVVRACKISMVVALHGGPNALARGAGAEPAAADSDDSDGAPRGDVGGRSWVVMQGTQRTRRTLTMTCACARTRRRTLGCVLRVLLSDSRWLGAQEVKSFSSKGKASVRDLRIREDTAKYLLNLDVDSAFYDPKSRCVCARTRSGQAARARTHAACVVRRSMREDPNPDKPMEEKIFAGDNFQRCAARAARPPQAP